MYCKYCGHEIADDSRFCKYCGKIVEETNNKVVEHQNEPIAHEVNVTEEEIDTSKIEVHFTATNTHSIPVEILKTSKCNKASIANEIVGNLKMVILAILLSGTYFLINLAIKYDPVDNIFAAWDVSLEKRLNVEKEKFLNSYWELIYVKQIHNKYSIPNFNLRKLNELTPYDGRFKRLYDSGRAIMYSDLVQLADETAALYLSEKDIKSYKTEAQSIATIQQKSLTKEVNQQLWDLFWWHFSDTYLIAVIVSFALTICGRYLIKLIQWVQSNHN